MEDAMDIERFPMVVEEVMDVEGMQVEEVMLEDAMQVVVPSGDYCGRGGRSNGGTV